MSHIQPLRIWEIAQENATLTGAELRHLETCNDCQDFMREFIEMSTLGGSEAIVQRALSQGTATYPVAA